VSAITPPSFTGIALRTSRLAIASLLCGLAVLVLGFIALLDPGSDFSDLLTLALLPFLIAAVALCILAHRAVWKAPERLTGTMYANAGAILAVGTLGAAALIIPVTEYLQEATARSASAVNLKQISLAMNSYAENNSDHRLPPSALRDQDSRPLLSWRVLLLPYIGEEDLYRQFHLDEPWDSPHNLTLLPKMPRTYAVRGPTVDRPPGTTFYQVFTGPDAAFETTTGARLPNDFSKPSATILVVEAGTAVPWTKPQDIEYDPQRPLPQLGGQFPGPGRFRLLPSGRRKGVMVGMGDGSFHSVKASMPEHTWRWAISRTTTEQLPPEW
jgi:hypothetical protein